MRAVAVTLPTAATRTPTRRIAAIPLTAAVTRTVTAAVRRAPVTATMTRETRNVGKPKSDGWGTRPRVAGKDQVRTDRPGVLWMTGGRPAHLQRICEHRNDKQRWVVIDECAMID